MDHLAAIAAPSREEILRLVWKEERRAGDIAAHLPITFGAVSQHLAVLLQANLVVVRRQGRERWYTANRAALGPFAAALEQFWSERLGVLKALAEDEQKRIDSAKAAASPPPRRTRHPHKRDPDAHH